MYKQALGVLVGLLCAAVTVVATPPDPAAAVVTTNWSETATLGDGVAGLDVDRSTTIESQVWAIASVGDVMLVGGAFTDIRDRSNYDTIPHPYLAGFDPTTGEYIPWLNTQPDGPVYAIEDLGNGQALVAGEFTSINGLPGTEGLAIIDTTTGLVDTTLSVDLGPGSGALVRAVAVDGNDLYITGSFSSISVGGVSRSAGGVAKINLATRTLTPSFLPTLQTGGGWGIGVDAGKVFIGGYFFSVNNLPDTEVLAAVDANTGQVITGWNNGFPHDRCVLSWRATCGAVNGLRVHDGKVFVAGAKHFWAALSVSDGTILADYEISNDGQSVDIVNDMVVIGCHCSTSTGSDEFPGIEDRYVRIIDPDTLHEVASPTVNSEGAAGGWAAGGAPDQCLWVGGNFTSTRVGGTSHPGWNLLRFCPTNGAGTNPALSAPVTNGDSSAPTTPGTPAISNVASTTISLQWAPASDNSGQVAYVVMRNGEIVGRTGETSFDDPLLGYNSTYEWQVAAIDMAGNMSAVSATSIPVRVGPAVNVATQATATQSSDFNTSTVASNAIDGNTNGNDPNLVSRTGARPPNSEGWLNLDLGQIYHVDRVILYPRTDSAFLESNTRPRIYQSTTEITELTRATANIGGYSVFTGNAPPTAPRVEEADISNSIRYLRIFNSTYRTSYAEVQVWTSSPQPTPAPSAPDTTDPGTPNWKAVSTRGDIGVLRWGPASDNRGVVRYEVYDQDGALVWTTAETSAPVGPPGQLSRDFTVIAYDAAGNASAEIPNQGPDPQDIEACAIVRDGTSVAVSWTGATGADRYIVRRSVNASPFYWRGAALAGETAWSDTDRDDALVYTVTAKFGTTLTAQVECSEGGAADPVPEGFEITRIEKRRTVLHWDDEENPVEIERDGVIIDTEDDGWYTNTGLTPDTTYTYRIRYEDANSWSDPIEIQTLPDGVVEIVRPEACSVSEADGVITVSWDTPPGNPAIIIHRQVNGGTWYWRGRVDVPGTTFTDTDRDGTIVYRIKSRYPNGDSGSVICTAL